MVRIETPAARLRQEILQHPDLRLLVRCTAETGVALRPCEPLPPNSAAMNLCITKNLTFHRFVLGLGAALALSRSMASLLYDVSATDPATFAVIALVAILTALLASMIPALRAVRLDPVKALRAE